MLKAIDTDLWVAEQPLTYFGLEVGTRKAMSMTGVASATFRITPCMLLNSIGIYIERT